MNIRIGLLDRVSKVRLLHGSEIHFLRAPPSNLTLGSVTLTASAGGKYLKKAGVISSFKLRQSILQHWSDLARSLERLLLKYIRDTNALFPLAARNEEVSVSSPRTFVCEIPSFEPVPSEDTPRIGMVQFAWFRGGLTTSLLQELP